MREQLVEGMKIVLADTFALYLKTHQFHWNVEGPDFPQYHEFLENLYTEVYGSVDKIAEEIRALVNMHQDHLQDSKSCQI